MPPTLRSSVVRALTAVTLCATADTLAAQTGWSAEFDRPGLLGRVFALGEFQGELVAGGLGIQGDGEMFGLTARFDGTHWRRMGSGIGGGSGYDVRAFAEYQGSLYVGGEFCCAGGQSIANIARWDGTQWSPVGGGVDGIVFALEEYQGELYAGGEFSSAGGVPVQGIARWNGSAWQAVGGVSGGQPSGACFALFAAPDQRLYASGEFHGSGGQALENVAAWDGSSWSALGGGLPGPLNGVVWDLEWFGGQLYAAGNFDLLPGATLHDKVVTWDGASWSSAGFFPDSSIGTTVYCLEVFGSALYAGGNIVEADGVSVRRMARYDGLAWASVGGVSGSSQTTTVFDLQVHGGTLIAGGEFSQAGLGFLPGQAVVAESVARYDGAVWDSVGTGLGFNEPVEDTILWNGKVVAAGRFWEAGSQLVNGPVMLEGDDWVQLASTSGTVDGLGLFQGDLILVGGFTSVDGQPIEGVARYDGTQWTGFGTGGGGVAAAEYQGQLYVGGLGGVKRWNGVAWESFAPQIFGQVLDLHVHDGVLYIGGSLSGDGHVLSWDGTTQQTLGGGANGSVHCFESFEGDLIVGGAFTTAGGVSIHRLARWNGSSYSEFPGITGTVVDALAVFRGELCASGNLIVPGLPPNKYVAHWDGATWQPFGGGIEGQPGTLTADDAAGKLYAGGIIAQADDLPSWYFACWIDEPFVVGTPYCFGDGGGTPCPCANEDPSGAAGCTNGSGSGAVLSAAGSTSVTTDDLVLIVANAVPGQPALFFQGDARTNGGSGLPLGDGLRCAGQGVVRLELRSVGPGGAASTSVSVADAGGVAPGETRHYQVWYRDPLRSVCDTNSNLTNGLSIDWVE